MNEQIKEILKMIVTRRSPSGDKVGIACASRLAAETLKLLNSPQWQPMDSAPKDGTIIVAYNPGSHSDNKYETAMWSYNAWRPRKHTAITFPNLTHWQPLPEPPKGVE